jgi:hypothetical protein
VSQLRRVEVTYIGFDGQTHHGDLIVHEDLTAEAVAIFDQLLQLRYPIEKIRKLDDYPGADDELSMEDNNTSAFNCREIPGSGHWSLHASGRAIDVNPLLNPEIDRTGAFQPTNAAPYVDRNRTDPGVLHTGDAAVRSPIVVGAGAVTGELPRTISTLSADRHPSGGSSIVVSSLMPLTVRMRVSSGWAMSLMWSVLAYRALIAALSRYSTALRSTVSVSPLPAASVVAVARARLNSSMLLWSISPTAISAI